MQCKKIMPFSMNRIEAVAVHVLDSYALLFVHLKQLIYSLLNLINDCLQLSEQ